MPSIKDESTVNKIAEVFCGEGKRNKAVTLRIVGYADSTCVSGICREKIYENVRVKAAIAKIDAKTQAKYEHNQEISVKKLYTDYGYLEQQAKAGNIAAINARTAIVRELDCTTGLQKQTITNKSDEPDAVFSDELWKDWQACLNREKLRKANERA